MEVYTLDALLRRTELFEDFESLIWTERYRQYGDFELVIASTYRTRTLLKTDVLLAMSMSNRMMKIENVEDAFDSDNKRMLSVKGRSIEAIMYDRVAALSLTDTTTTPTWDISGLTPENVMRKIFHDICVTGTLSISDTIPFIQEGSFAEGSNIPESTDTTTIFSLQPTTVYDALSQIAESYDLGFRILRQGDMSKIWFDVYTGTDRTTTQNLVPAVVFSPQLDNLEDVSQLISTEDAKNVAYVFSPAGFQMVYASGVDPAVAGFDRRVLVVDATDITDPGDGSVNIPNALIQRGFQELAKAQTVQSLDGEINQRSVYQPGRDYFVGDLIEERNDDGQTNKMRVTEVIYASDSEGERSYPTLTLNQFVNAGSWIAWRNQKTWLEWDSETVIPYWADQP